MASYSSTPTWVRIVITAFLAVVLSVIAAFLASPSGQQPVPGSDTESPSTPAERAPDADVEHEQDAEPEAEPSPEPDPEPAVFTIGAVGDVLPHDTPIRMAHLGGDDYDFTPLLEATRAWSEGVDIAICNMEVTLALPGERPTGYPIFAAPAPIVGNLAGLGWDGCVNSSNHTLDRGAANAKFTLDVFDEAGMGHAGSARSPEEEASPQFYELERGGQTIRVAQIGATFSTNGMPIPADEPWVITMLEIDKVTKLAQTARDQGADLVVASLHWGNEYELSSSAFQRDFAAQVAQTGLVDLIIGNHPHVPQEYALLDGGPRGEGMWVAYSLGNFISNQDSNCCIPETATGIFMTATVEKPFDGPARVTGMEWTPMTVDRLGRNYAYPLLEIMDERPELLTLSMDVMQDRLARVERIMAQSTGAEFTMRRDAPVPTGPPAEVILRKAGN